MQSMSWQETFKNEFGAELPGALETQYKNAYMCLDSQPTVGDVIEKCAENGWLSVIHALVGPCSSDGDIECALLAMIKHRRTNGVIEFLKEMIEYINDAGLRNKYWGVFYERLDKNKLISAASGQPVILRALNTYLEKWTDD
jgi:hypothetical protein